MAVLTIRRGDTRHIRHRKFKGLTRGAARPRLQYLQAWLDERATDLNGTGTGQTFTAAVSDIITIAGHGFSTGQGPFIATTSGTLPAGIVLGELYWIFVIDVNTFRLQHSRIDAFNDANQVDVSDTGSGTHTFTPADTSGSFIEYMRQNGITPAELDNETDVDNLV